MGVILMVIELYGCPGVGKSTVVKSVEKILEQNGVPFFNYYDIFYDGTNSTMHRIFSYILAIITPQNINVNIHILKACLQLKCHLKYAVYLMYLYKRIKDAERKDDRIILLDEGIIQFISSMSHEKKISQYPVVISLIDSILHSGIKVKAVECKLPLKDNLYRLTNREQKSRFLKSNDQNTIYNLLVKKKDNVDFVASHFEIIASLDMTKSINENVTYLFGLIMSQIHAS